ncbi:hypothetical protein R1flu_025252 [Riccia fluitans]|uniref:Uncharacterized protein n=1 Tax=Riccia fluitans TaxID=41844 RepID=A0ABD1XX69_9MARC
MLIRVGIEKKNPFHSGRKILTFAECLDQPTGVSHLGRGGRGEFGIKCHDREESACKRTEVKFSYGLRLHALACVLLSLPPPLQLKTTDHYGFTNAQNIASFVHIQKECVQCMVNKWETSQPASRVISVQA